MKLFNEASHGLFAIAELLLLKVMQENEKGMFLWATVYFIKYFTYV